MGTLTDQNIPRIESSFSGVYEICKEVSDVMYIYDLTFEQVLEVVKLSVQIRDYDVKDEQLAGFGEIMQQLLDILK